MSRDLRQLAVLNWICNVFGEVTTNRRERVSRVLEEAIELAQAEDLPIERARAMVEYVYSKPPGIAHQEAAGVGVTLLAYCGSVGISADKTEEQEVQRITSLPAKHFRERQQIKADAGLSDPVVL